MNKELTHDDWYAKCNLADALQDKVYALEAKCQALLAIAQPEQIALPSCYSDDAVAFIEKHLALRNYPANSHNAARAGWDAACDLLTKIAQSEQLKGDAKDAPRVPITGALAAEFCVWLGPQIDENLDKYTLAARAFAAGKATAKPEGDAKDAERLKRVVRDIQTVLRIEGLDLESGSRKLLKESITTIAAIASQKGTI